MFHEFERRSQKWLVNLWLTPLLSIYWRNNKRNLSNISTATTKCRKVVKYSKIAFKIIGYLSDGSSFYVRRDKRSPKMCLKSNERSRIITKDFSEIVGDGTLIETKIFPIHFTNSKVDKTPWKFSATHLNWITFATGWVNRNLLRLDSH